MSSRSAAIIVHFIEHSQQGELGLLSARRGSSTWVLAPTAVCTTYDPLTVMEKLIRRDLWQAKAGGRRPRVLHTPAADGTVVW